MPQRNRGSVEVTLDSQHALNLPVTASRIRAQNALSSSRTSQRTLTERDIANLPKRQAPAHERPQHFSEDSAEKFGRCEELVDGAAAD